MQFSRMSAARRISSVLSAGFRPCLPSERPTQCLRFLSFTSPRRAVEGPKIDHEAMAAFRNTTTFQKISQHPEAILAIQKFGEIMQRNGIDTTSGKAPSMFQVSKLFLNAEVREAAKNLVEEFKKAGVDVNAKEIMEEMAIFSKMGGGPKS